MSNDEVNRDCRNCGGQDHYLTEVNAGGGIFPSVLPLGFSGWLKNPRYRLRVCGTCGLTDWFVVEEFLEAVREKFVAENKRE
jgi:predicted nucleic-acid-binding Zn-ribbon protein